jgi:hypothetical protein
MARQMIPMAPFSLTSPAQQRPPDSASQVSTPSSFSPSHFPALVTELINADVLFLHNLQISNQTPNAEE